MTRRIFWDVATPLFVLLYVASFFGLWCSIVLEKEDFAVAKKPLQVVLAFADFLLTLF